MDHNFSLIAKKRHIPMFLNLWFSKWFFLYQNIETLWSYNNYQLNFKSHWCTFNDLPSPIEQENSTFVCNFCILYLPLIALAHDVQTKYSLQRLSPADIGISATYPWKDIESFLYNMYVETAKM